MAIALQSKAEQQHFWPWDQPEKALRHGDISGLAPVEQQELPAGTSSSGKDVVEQFYNEMKEKDTQGMKDLLGDAARIVTHGIRKTTTLDADELEKKYEKKAKSMQVPNDVKIGEEVDGKIEARGKVNTPFGPMPVKTVFTMGDDNKKIEKVESWPLAIPFPKFPFFGWR